MSGPGTELKGLFGTLGMKPWPDCECLTHAQQMDDNGCDWCRTHIDRIVGWVKLEAKKQQILFVKPVVVGAIKMAIFLAERKGHCSDRHTV